MLHIHIRAYYRIRPMSMSMYIYIARSIGGGAEGGREGQRGSCPPLADKGGKRYQMPPFRRLSGMMPASTEKNIGIYR